jgi:hypothetical protein
MVYKRGSRLHNILQASSGAQVNLTSPEGPIDMISEKSRRVLLQGVPFENSVNTFRNLFEVINGNLEA